MKKLNAIMASVAAIGLVSGGPLLAAVVLADQSAPAASQSGVDNAQLQGRSAAFVPTTADMAYQSGGANQSSGLDKFQAANVLADLPLSQDLLQDRGAPESGGATPEPGGGPGEPGGGPGASGGGAAGGGAAGGGAAGGAGLGGAGLAGGLAIGAGTIIAITDSP